MMKTIFSNYTHRLLARFVVEAKTPIKISTGEKDFLTDALVAVDVNGLPYLPGTSLAGVIRSMLDPEKKSSVWGYQRSNEGHGSEIIVSDGHVLDMNGRVVDGIREDLLKDNLEDKVLDVLKYELPIRQHVRINHVGTAEKTGKFDEQVVLAGTRFCFEVEIVTDKENIESMDEVVKAVRHDTFRIGGGSRKGFGSIEVVSVQTRVLNLAQDMNLYLQKSSNLDLSAEWPGWQQSTSDILHDKAWTTYKIDLLAQDFLLMGSGFADPNGDADITAVKARKIVWTTNPAKVEENMLLIPATSLKGALRHRTVYHYNKILKRYAQEGVCLSDLANPAEINKLFGSANGKEITRGKVLFEDLIADAAQPKLMNHVAIDRFTGGAMDGALYAEQVDEVSGREFHTEVKVNKADVAEDAILAFEMALTDLTTGLLPLGGGVNRGHGIFTGSFTKNE